MRLLLALIVSLWAIVGCAEAQSLPHNIPDFGASPTITSVSNGPWSNAATWNPARVPQAGDCVRVAHSVTYTQVSDIALDCVGITGTLTFSTTENTRLKVGNLLVYASGFLDVDLSAAPDKTAEIIIADKALVPASDPERYGTAFLGFGKVRLRGATKSPTFTRATAELSAGTVAIPLTSAPNGWNTGDRLLIPGTQQWFPDVEPWAETWETPTLSSVSGANLTTSALAHTHNGARDADGTIRFLPHVGNLSRNVIIRSENPSGTRGHVLYTMRADVDSRYVLYKDLGRTTIAPLDSTNVKGRYALHLHHLIGPVATPQNGYQFTLIGNAIEAGTKWGITLHNTHYGLVQDNVVYNVQGAGIMTEDGNESFNVIERNFIVRAYGTGEERGDMRGIWNDAGYEGSGIWLRGVNNYVRDNVVANVNSFAYGLYPLDLTYTRIPKFKGADVAQADQYDERDGQATPILEFARNEVYAAYSGLTIWDVGADCCTQVKEIAESTVKDFGAWHLGRHGLYGYGMNRVTFDGWTQRGSSQYSWSAFVFDRGLWWGDYISRNIVVRNADIQGVRAGIEAPYKAGDTSDIYGTAPGTILIEDSNVASVWGYVAQPQYAVTGGGHNLPPRTVTIRNSRWSPLPWTLPAEWTQVGIAKSFFVDERNANIMVADRVLVDDWQGVSGDDFEVFSTAQAGGFVPPPSSSGLVGSPVADATNTQLWASHTSAVGGAITPCTATRPGVNGFACSGSSPPPPSHIPPATPLNVQVVPSSPPPASLHAMSRSFNGTTNYVSAGDIAAVEPAGTSWTIATWFKASSLAAEGKLVAKWNGGTLQYLLSIGSDGHVVGAIHDGTDIRAITGTATYTTGQWVLAVLRQSGTGAGSLTLRTGLAGAGSLSADGSATTSAGPQNTDVELLIGSGGAPGSLENPFSGLISRTAVWTSATLTTGQADALLTASPNNIGVSPNFYIISSVNELVDYAGGASLTNNGSTYDSDEPFVEGAGGAVRASQHAYRRRRVN